jgi:hypothetical protein
VHELHCDFNLFLEVGEGIGGVFIVPLEKLLVDDGYFLLYLFLDVLLLEFEVVDFGLLGLLAGRNHLLYLHLLVLASLDGELHRCVLPPVLL